MAQKDFGNIQLDNSLYSVTYKNAFNGPEQNQIKGVQKIINLNKKLSTMGDKGWNKFNKLDSDVQNQLKSLYGQDKEYMKEPESGWGSVWNFAKDLAINVNPITWAWRGIELYSHGFNTVVNVLAQGAENDANIFDSDVWSSTWNGEGIFNNDEDKRLQQKYGKVKSFIAKQSLSGKTPGEIIAAYGKLTPEFLKEMESFLNDQVKWNEGILEDYRQASVSFGRWAARSILGARSGKGDAQDTWFTGISGTIDAAISIAADPLTYLTFGAGKGVMLFGQAMNQSAKIYKMSKIIAQAPDAAADVSKLFKFKKVSSYWDDYGRLLKDYDTAMSKGNEYAMAEVKQQIIERFPEHALDDHMALIAKEFKDLGEWNAKGAEAFFSRAQNTQYLLHGRTANTTFYRDSIAFAKRSRLATQYLRSKWLGYGEGRVTEKDIMSSKKDVWDEFTSKGAEEDIFKNVDTPAIEKFKDKNLGYRARLFNVLSRSAGDSPIIVGEGVEKTLPQVRLLAQGLLGKSMGDVFAEQFYRATEAERIVALRGMYRGIMESVGLDKTSGGRELMEEILNGKFGPDAMAVSRNLEAPSVWGLANPEIAINGAISEHQLTSVIGNLPWQRIREAAADVAWKTQGRNKGGKMSVVRTVGGAVNGTYASRITDSWSLFTLAPKLGIRSAIDEAFMFGLTAPKEVAMNYLRGKGRAGGMAITTYTSSKKAIGVGSNLLRKALKPIIGKWKPNIDVTGAISEDDRLALWKGLVDNAPEGTPIEALANSYFDLLASRAIGLYKNLGEEEAEHLFQALRGGLHSADSATASIGRYTGGGKVDDSVREILDDISVITRMEKDFKITSNGEWRLASPKEFGAMGVAPVMFKNMYMRFTHNRLGGYLHLGEFFIKHNGLKTADNFAAAMADVKSIIANQPKLAKKIIDTRAGSVASGRKGLSDEEIIDEILTANFADMYRAFHGSKDGFNQQLLDELRTRMWNVTKPKNVSDKEFSALDEVIRTMEYDDYAKLVANNLEKSEIATDIVKLDGVFDNTAAGLYAKFGDKMWEAMDRTATALLRQPAVMSYYFHYRKLYKNFENKYASDLFDEQMARWAASPHASKYGIERFADADGNYVSKIPTLADVLANPKNFNEDVLKLARRSQNGAARYFTEHGMENAVSHVLKFVDNPHVRSNLTMYTRNISRFYRAIEDFYRRIYRLKDVSSQSIYRLRLIHSGLNGAGIIEKDQNGNEYMVMPMDNVLYAALDPVVRKLSGGNMSFQQPLFSQFTFKMTGLNPSFQDDAGLPTLSGPIGAVSVLGLKGIVSKFGSTGEQISEDLDNMLLGDIGDNIDIRKAIVPASLDRIWQIFDSNSKAMANNSATLSAIAYMQANAQPLPPNISKAKREKLLATGMYALPADATAKEKADYLNNIRISGHNLVAIRSIFGLLMPASPGIQESLGIPDYIKDNGITNIRQEYSEILDTLFEKYGDDISDPYEVAAAMFIGNNPGKLAYTVSRESSESQKFIKSTNETRNWIMQNREFINRYGDAAYLFSPNSGEFTIGAYNWMKAAGLIENIGDEEYLTKIQTVKDKQTYFDIGQNLDKQLATTVHYQDRKLLIDRAEMMRSALKMSNPYLAAELESGGFSVTPEQNMLSGINEIMNDKNSPITSDQRKRLKYGLMIFNRAYNYIQDNSLQQINGYSQLKLGMRDRAMAELENLIQGDQFMRQIYNYVFKPILKYYARDVDSATPTNQGAGFIAPNSGNF